ncbi:MAG TPA: 2-oxo acid dehydrogenase subunit E2 [Planctomycetota bacterium]|nr:2-oxo acid dehydrogenase subunit E2 [Planctomycetota bacterium]
MSLKFKLPDIGEGVAEGEVVKWLVDEGQRVEEHQGVVEVMTDKATVEIPAPAAGIVLRRHAKEGDVVPVGSVLFELETAATPSRAQATGADEPARQAPASEALPVRPTPPAQPAARAAKPQPAAATATAEAPRATAPTSAPSSAAPGRLEFKLPDIGEGVAEGEIVKWLVQVGETVAEPQAVVEVMTDKATVEIPSPAAGRIAEQRVKAGEVVPVGAVLYVLEVGPGAAPAASRELAAERPEPAAARAEVAEPPAEPATDGERDGNGRVLAVPSARRVARELGIDLREVSGSGRNGVIRRSDVEDYAKQRRAAPAPPAAPIPARTPAPAALARAPAALEHAELETRVPFRGVRRKIAEAMVRSKQTAPHFTVVEELDVTELVKVREVAKAMAAESGVKLTYMPFIMKAVASGLARYPELNSKLDEAAQEIVTYAQVNLGIATDTSQGLIVPVIRDVQSKGLLQLAKELVDLADRTRAGKFTPEELKGSTFSITNAGNIGGTLATPIINFPDAGILGVHRIVKRPGVVEVPEGDRIEVRHYMNLSISVDHRIVDGATAVRFLVHLKKILEAPGLLAL